MMSSTERNAIISLLEDALDKIALENYPAAEQLINRALYWANAPDDDLYGDDPEDSDELDFSR